MEVDRAFVEQRPNHAMGLTQPGDGASPVPLDPVLLERGEIPDTQDHLGPAAAQLVEGGGKLSDRGRIPQIDGGDTRTEADPFGAARGGREHHPGVLVVDLVGAVAGVVAKRVRSLGRCKELLRRLLRNELETHPHRELAVVVIVRGVPQGAAPTPRQTADSAPS